MRHAPWGLIDKVKAGMRTPWPIQCLRIRFYATLVIKFVLHHRFSAILVIDHSKFHGRSTSLTGLEYQYPGYSYNLAGVASPY